MTEMVFFEMGFLRLLVLCNWFIWDRFSDYCEWFGEFAVFK